MPPPLLTDDSIVDSDIDDTSEDGDAGEIEDLVQHLRWAERLIGEICKPWAQLTPKQIESIEFVVREPQRWKMHVLERLKHWEVEAERWKPALDNFHAKLTPDTLPTLGKLDPFILTSMVRASNHVDQLYVEALLAGFPVSGKVDSHGLDVKPMSELMTQGSLGLHC